MVYECVKTIATIYPKPALLDTAASSISQFITSKSNNLKYIGIDGLSMIMTIEAKHVQRHHMQVIDCLRSPDDSLKRKVPTHNSKNPWTLESSLVLWSFRLSIFCTR